MILQNRNEYQDADQVLLLKMLYLILYDQRKKKFGRLIDSKLLLKRLQIQIFFRKFKC